MKVALLQGCSGDDLELNVRWLESSLQEVSGADFVVLPEMWSFLVPDSRGEERKRFANEYEDVLRKELASLSSVHQCCLVAGSLFLPAENSDKVTNSSLIYLEGSELSRYDKCHLFDNNLEGDYGESRTVQAGKGAVTFSYSGWEVGQSICYDLRFPYHFSSLREQGAELVVCPSAFTWKTGKAHWETLVRARAIENQVYMLAVNQCGRSSAGVSCWGHSLLVDPWGEVLLDLGDSPVNSVSEISRDKVISCRESMPVWDHRRETSKT